MRDFETKLAYEIGVKIASEEYLLSLETVSVQDLEKVAQLGALKNIWSGTKWLAGFGGGGTVSRTLGSATGFGAMGAATAEEGLENKLKGFAGGFAGGLAFSAAMPLLGRVGKGFNASWSSSAKNLSQKAKDQAKALDASKRQLQSTQKELARAGNKATDQMKEQAKALQDSYKQNVSAYKDLMKSEGVGVFGRGAGALSRNYGTALGLGLGLGGGMYVSGAVQGNIDSKQRALLPYQNNQFNPVI